MKFFDDEKTCSAFETIAKLAEESANVYNILEMREALETLLEATNAPWDEKWLCDRERDAIKAVQAFFDAGGSVLIRPSEEGTHRFTSDMAHFKDCVKFVV